MATPKSSLFGTVLLFACFLLLAPLVQSCYLFSGYVSVYNGQAELQILENHTMVCEYSGLPTPEPSPSPSSSASPAPSPSGGDSIWVYFLTCTEGYAATFEVDVNPNTFSGLVAYVRPGDTLEFGLSGRDGDFSWQICEPGCTNFQCKV